MGFAAALGGTIAGMAAPEQTLLEQFGVDIGVALQMFDDLGNVMGKCDPQKRYEDLSLARPSWVWACAANASDRYIYEAFLDAVARLPDVEPFERWLAGHNLIDVTRASARRQLERAYQRLEQGLQRAGINWSARALGELRLLGEEIAVAYG